MTDDEAMRIAGMTDGPRKAGKFKLRPLSAESLAWAQTVGIFDDEVGEIHRIAGYVMIHVEPLECLLDVVFKKQLFWKSVSKWMRENVQHHADLTPHGEKMNDAWARYDAANTTAAHPNDPGMPQPKN